MQVAFTLGALFGNHYYHHRNRVNIFLGLESMPQIPSIKNDPPEFSIDQTFEPKIDKIAADIESQTRDMPATTLFDDCEYRGVSITKDKQTVPHGVGTYEIGQTKIVGSFEYGSLNGPFKFMSREKDIVLKAIMNGKTRDGTAVTYSKGCKYEVDMATRNYIFTDPSDNKAFVQMMPGNYRFTKFYDGEGRKLYSEYRNSRGFGFREMFEEDGSRLTMEMKNGQLDGNSVYKDKYGDIVYKGSFQNGDATKWWSSYTEVGMIFGICMLSTFWPRNPKRALAGMKKPWLRLFGSRRVGSF